MGQGGTGREDTQGNVGEQRRVSGAQLQQLVVSQQVKVMCLWGDDSPLHIFYQRVEFILEKSTGGSSWFRDIVKIERVVQKDAKVRFDVYVRQATFEKVLTRFRDRSRSYGWYSRLDVPYNTSSRVRSREIIRTVRIRGGQVAPPVPLARVTNIRVATYNINGIGSKLVELRNFLSTKCIDVICLQETLLSATDWSLRIPGFKFFNVYGQRGHSERGLSIGVTNRLNASQINTGNAFATFVRIYGATMGAPTIVGSVYVPVRVQRREVLATMLPRVLEQVQRQYPGEAMILGGDWNLTQAELAPHMVRWPGQLVRVNQPRGPTRRRTNHRTPRMVDHFVVSNITNPRGLELNAAVDHSWDMSDHFPVITNIPCLAAPEENVNVARVNEVVARPRIKGKTDTIKQAFASTNRWEILLDEFESEEFTRLGEPVDHLNSMTSRVTEVAHDIAVDHDLIASPRVGGNHLSGPTKRILNRRRRIWVDYQRSIRRNDGTSVALRQTYEAILKESKYLIRRERQRAFIGKVHRAHTNMSRDPKEFWRFAKSLGGWRADGSTLGLTPVKDPSRENTLVTDKVGIVDLWRLHYEGLAADGTGHSKDPEHWNFIRALPQNPRLLSLNDPFSRVEIWVAIGKMKPGKAPGLDGVPTEVLKATLVEQRRVEAAVTENQQREPQNRVEEPIPGLTLILLRMCNTAFAEGVIPEEWKTSVVVSIHKKGDVSVMDNYRGISLMPTVLKLLTVMIGKRIMAAGEHGNLFSRAQAGFRSKEECVLQAACLIEIAQRRRMANKSTFLTFVDIKKAYDTVPHEALFAKLERFGICGQCLEFIKALYANSQVSVRVGGGEDTTFSPIFRLDKGLRQGCPLSPDLFDIFIDDLPQGRTGEGVLVPVGGNAPKTKPEEYWETKSEVINLRVGILLFADDAVGLDEDIIGVQEFCDSVNTWCVQNEMKVGITKCGILEIPPLVGGQGDMEDPILTEAHPARDALRIMGELVPIVEEYEYLGLVLNRNIRQVEQQLAKQRREKGWKCLMAMTPFLSGSSFPIAMRIQVVKSVLIPVLLYGAEIFGMNRSVSDPLQSIVNKAVRKILGLKTGWRKASGHALNREMGLLPMTAYTNGRKARGYAKAWTLKTYVHDVVTNTLHPGNKGNHPWSYKTRNWVDRTVTNNEWTVDRDNWTAGWYNDPSLPPARVKRVVEQATRRREEAIQGNNRARFDIYVEHLYGQYPLWTVGVGYLPKYTVGLQWIVRFRVGAVLLAHEHKVMRLHERAGCPWCHSQGNESLDHLVFECGGFSDLRRGRISILLAEVEELPQGHPATEDGGPELPQCANHRLSWLLGSSVEGRFLQNWGVTVPEGTPDQPTHNEEVHPEDHELTGAMPPYLIVGEYLSSLMRLRTRMIGDHVQGLPPENEVDRIAMDQRPNG